MDYDCFKKEEMERQKKLAATTHSALSMLPMQRLRAITLYFHIDNAKRVMVSLLVVGVSVIFYKEPLYKESTCGQLKYLKNLDY